MGKLELQIKVMQTQLQEHIASAREEVMERSDAGISFLETRLVSLEEKQDFMVRLLQQVATALEAKDALSIGAHEKITGSYNVLLMLPHCTL